MSGYTNDGAAASQLRAMLRIVIRQAMWRATAIWLERRARRLPDNWLTDRFAEAETEALDELMAVLSTLGIAP